MKKLILKPIVGILISVFFSSCAAIHSGYMTNSVALSSANFSYVKQNIKGESVATYFLFLGGTKNESLVGEAKQNMAKNYQLGNNQALSNITVNFKNSTFLGIFNSVKCTITADVVEFK